MRIAIIIILALLVLGVAYYFLIYKSSNNSGSGSECDPNKKGFQKDGTENANCNGAGNIVVVDIDTSSGVAPLFNKGAMVYLNPSTSYVGTQVASGIPIYRYPLATAQGTYLVGVVRPDRYINQPIGKYVEQAGSSEFSKVNLSNIQIWKFVNGQYTNQTDKITGDYFINNAHIQKSIY